MLKYNKKCLYCINVFASKASTTNYCSTDCSFFHRIREYNSCWNWLGNIAQSGTINFKVEGRSTTAPRYAYEKYKGILPKGGYVVRTCGNDICVNPEHLLHTYNSTEGTKIQNEKARDALYKEIKADLRPNKILSKVHKLPLHMIRDIKYGRL
jgi:hypothetical protein